MSLPLVTATGTIRNGKLHIANRAQFDETVRALGDGWQVEIEITRLRATRSGQANRYYWGVVIKALHDLTGYTDAELHDLMKAKFLPKELAFTDGNGDVVEAFVLGGSTRGLNTQEFSEYVNRIRDWAADKLGLYIPEANEAGYGAGI